MRIKPRRPDVADARHARTARNACDHWAHAHDGSDGKAGGKHWLPDQVQHMLQVDHVIQVIGTRRAIWNERARAGVQWDTP